jgi:putative glutamine amidotransferase
MRAVVGLSAYEEPARWAAWATDAVLLHSWYPRSVRRAGGIPVLVPPQEPEAAATIVERLDAVVLTGGPDVDATLYNRTPHEANDPPRQERDAFEIALYRAARDAGVPVLGVCRGLQIMAVAEGGTLVQHLPEVSEVTHRLRLGTFVDHAAEFAPGSLAHSLFGASATVNSSHHQAVAEPGRLTVTGWAPDGTIEICEDPQARFLLGVQWHPEHMADTRLMEALLGAVE